MRKFKKKNDFVLEIKAAMKHGRYKHHGSSLIGT
jgi:hypothetical protein